jgi:hypothetical protein
MEHINLLITSIGKHQKDLCLRIKDRLAMVQACPKATGAHNRSCIDIVSPKPRLFQEIFAYKKIVFLNLFISAADKTISGGIQACR